MLRDIKSYASVEVNQLCIHKTASPLRIHAEPQVELFIQVTECQEWQPAWFLKFSQNKLLHLIVHIVLVLLSTGAL